MYFDIIAVFKTLCLLGAIYGLLHKISFYHMPVDKHKCINCGKCVEGCPAEAVRLGFRAKRKEV
ncbi:MAG: 4Fe-4S binding protein [Lachnospiraceae bacterium]|nr:4Fe-4S binding protein [Lachnospiraceae bacterium]